SIDVVRKPRRDSLAVIRCTGELGAAAPGKRAECKRATQPPSTKNGRRGVIPRGIAPRTRPVINRKERARGAVVRRVEILLAGLLAVAAVHPFDAAAQPPRLSGVVLGVQDGGIAYMEDPQTGRVRAVRVGESVGDAEVVRIEADRVILQKGGDALEIRLSGG